MDKPEDVAAELIKLSNDIGALAHAADVVFVSLIAHHGPADDEGDVTYLTNLIANTDPEEFAPLIRDWLRRYDAGELINQEDAQDHA